MKINTISPYFNINRLHSANKLKNMPVCDVFVRSCSFKGDDKCYEEFYKWAKETGFVGKITDIINYKGKILGSGFEGSTYAIPNNDRWVLKKFKRANILPISIDKPEIEKIDDISPNLNIGQFIATIKIPVSNNLVQQVYVLKKQEGHSYGIGYTSKDEINNSTTKEHIKNLKSIASMPQSSYDKLIDDITYVTNQGYEFDCLNPHNIMYDAKAQQVNFVDIADKVKDDKTQYANVLFSLLDAEYAINFNTSDRPEKEEVNSLSAEICSKFISSMKKKNYYFSDSIYLEKITGMPAFQNVLCAKNKAEALEKLTEMGLYCK